jgi:dihydroxy-acid dehydratase
MLNGWAQGRAHRLRHHRLEGARDAGRGEIDYEEFIEARRLVGAVVGHCNTMGTASTMNALAEALGMSLPGCAAIPAPYRERGRSPTRPASASSRWCGRT